MPFEFEQFAKLSHYIIGGRWIIARCEGGRCCNQRVLNLKRFDPDMTVADLKKKTFRCSQCGSTKVEVIVEREREWRRRIKR